MSNVKKEGGLPQGSPLCYAFGKVREQGAFVFFDFGSTNNYLSVEVALNLQIHAHEMGETHAGEGPFEGPDTPCTSLIGKLRLHVQGNNFLTWRFWMTNFLHGKGYWDYIEGENDKAPRCPEENATSKEKKALKDWKQGKSKVMYWLSMSVSDSMMGYLESAPSPAIAWKSLEKLNEDHITVKNLQLKTDLNTVKQGNMSINDYASKIKAITNSLGSIGVTIDEDDVVAAMLEGLGSKYKNFKSCMNTRADVLDFTKMTAMLICEEKSLGLGASSSQRNISSD
ncbi:hypothetical protein L7F22_058119 [Adiantum nelumboides]|nr:hypothetical protein [Adiantum nelumboides]